MKRRSKIVATILCFAGCAILYAYGLGSRDRHHAPERLEWKNSAVEQLRSERTDRNYFVNRFGRTPSPGKRWDPAESEWLTRDTIICADGSWLAFRNCCQKENGNIHDLFIARDSEGVWHYSDFHFCIGAMVVGMRGQPASIASFRAEYHLRPFDGISDQALEPTWRE